MQKSERSLTDADRAALGRMVGKTKKFKKGGAVCRGAGGVDGGNRGAQFRGVR